MPRLSELLGDSASAVIDFPGASIHVTYRPSVYTREFESQLSQIDQSTPDDEARDRCDDLLSRLIVDWDLTDEDDEPILPKRGEIAAKVPVMFLVLCINRLVTALAGEATSGRKNPGMTTGTTTTTNTNTAQPTPMNRAERRAAARKP